MHTIDPAALRDAMRGVRALLLDLDGVVVVAGSAVPGSVEAIASLERRAVPYRIVTNTSLVSRSSLSRSAAKLGCHIPPERFQSALSLAPEVEQYKNPPLKGFVPAAPKAEEEEESMGMEDYGGDYSGQ